MNAAMSARLLPALAILVGMIAASVLSNVLRPNQFGHPQAAINLSQIVPENFVTWRIDTTISPVSPAPDLQEKVNKAYDETLSRTYVNDSGQRVMLSIAYGGDQTGRLRVHRPESCYTGQGFAVQQVGVANVGIPKALIAAKRLIARAGPRNEPITYWIRVGDSTVTGLIGQRLTQLRFGMTGEVPDGLIFRVSSIDPDSQQAFLIHERFIADLLGVLPPENLKTLVGTSRLKAAAEAK